MDDNNKLKVEYFMHTNICPFETFIYDLVKGLNDDNIDSKPEYYRGMGGKGREHILNLCNKEDRVQKIKKILINEAS
jgi:hypothetical protein